MTRARDLARIANSNALTVDSSGNVGIGSTVPTSKLSVVGIVSATSFSGNVTGTATSTTNIPNLTGDISSSNTVSTLATVNSNVGTFGNGTSIPTITVNAKGLITGVTTTAVNPANDGALTLAVSGTGLSGSASFTANQSGASSFTVTSNATNANTVSTIVARDGSGNFSAGTITASLTGTASNVTTNANLTGHVTSVGNAAVLGSFTSLQLLTALTDETGTGANVFATSPTLVTPALGTPSSGTLTSCTGLPITGITSSTTIGLGVGSIDLGHETDTTLARSAAGVVTIEGVEVVTLSRTQTLTNKTLTSPTLTTPVLGTPSSGTLTSCTGLPLSTGVTGTLPVANGGTGVTSSTGTGSVVLSASPTFTGTVGAAAITATGDIAAANFNSTSDINLKENIRQVESASELVSKLEGVHFSWKETGKETIGVIAQQIEEHLPQLVQTGDTHKTVNYNGLIGVLIEAVKEQGAQIAALQAEIEELKK